jgi:hypothetical protein
VKLPRGWATTVPTLLGSFVVGLLALALPRTNPVELFFLDAQFVVAPRWRRGAISDVAIVLMDGQRASLSVPTRPVAGFIPAIAVLEKRAHRSWR